VKFTSLFLLLAVLTLALTAAPAWADAITVTNPSFEMIDPAHPLGYSAPGIGIWNLGPIPGWAGVAGSWQPGPAAYNSVPDGKTVAFSNGGAIYQTLNGSLTPYTTYTLSVDVGHRLDGTDGYPTGYTIELLAGGVVIDSISGFSASIPKGAFQEVGFSYTSDAAPPSGDLGIALISGGIQSDFDDVYFGVRPAPEPASLALLATGLGLALFLFRRR
jgi:hypothetical protein